MACRSLAIALIGAILLASTVPPARASLFEPVSDNQLVCEATDIVRGQIADAQAAWDDQHQAIWTTATVRVDEGIRGTLAPGALIRVKEVGGTVDGYTIRAEGFPTFQAGEETVLLLRPWEDGSGTYRVWGYGRGLFAVDRHEGRTPVAKRHDVLESGQPTMHVDQLPPSVVLNQLTRQLRGLSRTCDAGPAQ